MRRSFVLLLGLAACRPTPSEPREDAPADMTESSTTFDPSIWNGRCVIVQGYAQEQKIGALLNLGGPSLGVVFDGGDSSSHPGDRADSQWTVPLGVHVRVKGRIAERADLPVFVQDPNEPIMQGMPVPEGTDLEEARRRFVIEHMETTVVRTPEQVEADLTARVGESVELGGILWSRNDVWWFSHEGVDLHLERGGGAAEWQDHGEAFTVRGKLSRRPMPRIDQLGLVAEPERAEAFVLTVDSLGPHPVWPIEACPE
jgi:hypothetical protein